MQITKKSKHFRIPGRTILSCIATLGHRCGLWLQRVTRVKYVSSFQRSLKNCNTVRFLLSRHVFSLNQINGLHMDQLLEFKVYKILNVV